MEGVPSDAELEQAAIDILVALPDVKTFALLDLLAALGVLLPCLDRLGLLHPSVVSLTLCMVMACFQVACMPVQLLRLGFSQGAGVSHPVLVLVWAMSWLRSVHTCSYICLCT